MHVHRHWNTLKVVGANIRRQFISMEPCVYSAEPTWGLWTYIQLHTHTTAIIYTINAYWYLDILLHCCLMQLIGYAIRNYNYCCVVAIWSMSYWHFSTWPSLLTAFHQFSISANSWTRNLRRNWMTLLHDNTNPVHNSYWIITSSSENRAIKNTTQTNSVYKYHQLSTIFSLFIFA